MWTIYLLRCSDGSLYCGITNDIKRRLNAHQAGKGAIYTRGRLPVALVYTEHVATKSKALKREIAIKKLPRAKKWTIVSKKPKKLKKNSKKCPECGSSKVIMFDADNDI